MRPKMFSETLLSPYNSRSRLDMIFDPASHINPVLFDAVITGTSDDETITGTEDDDIINDGGGQDTVFGLGGNDVITVSRFSTVFGGDGNDTIDGSSGLSDNFSVFTDRDLFGGAGDDVFSNFASTTAFGEAGNDTFFVTGRTRSDFSSTVADGGAGDDLFIMREGPSTMLGGNGDDLFSLRLFRDRAGLDFIDGGAGLDTFEVATRRSPNILDLIASFSEEPDGVLRVDYISGGYELLQNVEFLRIQIRTLLKEELGFFTVDLRQGTPTITLLEDSRANSDTFFGTEAADIIEDFRGDDELHGLGGDDYIEGGRNSDTIFGGDGNDTLYASSSDLISGYSEDRVSGGNGNDTIITNPFGQNIITGDLGDDIIYTGLNTVSSNWLAGNGGFDIVEYVGVKLLEFRSITEDASRGLIFLRMAEDAPIRDALHRVELLVFDDFTIDLQNDGLPNLVNLDDTTTRFVGEDVVNIVYASDEDSRLLGGAEDDYLVGGDGNDSLSGGAGNDRLISGLGRDALRGGDGDDYLEITESGNAFGNEGHDTIELVTLAGGRFDGGTGDDTFLVSRTDRSNVESGIRVIDGGDGYDIIDYGSSELNFSLRFGMTEGGKIAIYINNGTTFNILFEGIEEVRVNSDAYLIDDIIESFNNSLSAFDDLSQAAVSIQADADNLSTITDIDEDIDDFEFPDFVEFDVWI